MDKYLDKLVRAVPIESNFVKQLHDHLNAEIVGGTVTNITEAVAWLKYTYLYTRLVKSPLHYGITEKEMIDDPLLTKRCREFITDAVKYLHENMMIRYDQQSENVAMTDLGRVAAHFYIQSESISTFLAEFSERRINTSNADPNEPHQAFSDAKLCHIICSAAEFENMRVRQEETRELQEIVGKSILTLPGAGTDDAGRKLITGPADKAFILLQAYISRAKVKSFTLSSDMNYIASNAGRVARAVFEVCLKKQWATLALKLLRIAKSIESRFWWFQTPLRHFDSDLSAEVISSIESASSASQGYDTAYQALSILDMTASEVESLYRLNRQRGGSGVRIGERVQQLTRYLPYVEVSCVIQPTTAEVYRFHVEVIPSFEWNRHWHGGAQAFWLWVENGESNKILHEERLSLNYRTFPEPVILDFFVPCFSPRPQQYLIRVMSDYWVGMEFLTPVSTSEIQRLDNRSYESPVLDISPLPISALQNSDFEQIYSKMNYFNPVSMEKGNGDRPPTCVDFFFRSLTYWLTCLIARLIEYWMTCSDCLYIDDSLTDSYTNFLSYLLTHTLFSSFLTFWTTVLCVLVRLFLIYPPINLLVHLLIYSSIHSQVQSQLFHVLYHTDTPVFVGAPTGSGKVSELGWLICHA
jgi:activating signal cointegrator complex subunit 3